MTDEEKKAIELLKKLQKTKPYIIWGDGETPYNKSNMISTILELIEKQSKEIEELKEDKYGLEEEIQIQAKQLIEIDGNYISKDKIKAKIEEAKQKYNDLHTNHIRNCEIEEQRELAKIEFGQSLLEKE